MENETTLTEVLDAVNKGFTHVETQISGIKTDIVGIKTDMKSLENKLEMKIDVLTEHVDGFAKKQLDFDAELAAEISARKRLEERIA